MPYETMNCVECGRDVQVASPLEIGEDEIRCRHCPDEGPDRGSVLDRALSRADALRKQAMGE